MSAAIALSMRSWEALEQRAAGRKDMHVPGGEVGAAARSGHRSETKVGIVHLGVGGFHRAHQALYTQRAMEQFGGGWYICGVGLLPSDAAVRDALRAQDYLYCVLQRGDDRDELTVIASMSEMLLLHEQRELVLQRMASPDVKIVSLTITEKGYRMDPASRTLLASDAVLKHDTEKPEEPESAIGLLALALERRRRAQQPPFTVLSCDNVPLNGALLRAGVLEFGDRCYGDEFVAFVRDKCAFPSTMVDGITPMCSKDDVAHIERKFGIVDRIPTVCERWRQWCIEDAFPPGADRPPWHKLNPHHILPTNNFADSAPTDAAELVEDVAAYENTKICLLNVPHSALAYASWLLDLEFMHEAMSATDGDPLVAVRTYVEQLMALEITPYLRGRSPLDLEKYSASLVRRFAQASTRDSVLRVAQDGSSKYAAQLIPIAKFNVRNGIECGRLAFAVAAWAKHLLGVTDSGASRPISDGRAGELRDVLSRAENGGIEVLVKDEQIFGSADEQALLAPLCTQIVQLYKLLCSKSNGGVLAALQSLNN